MAAPASTSVPRRDQALDRLRSAAVVAMVIHHVIGWLTGGEAREVLPGWSTFAATDAAAPAFFVAAGMSTALFVQGRRRRSVPGWRATAQLMRRYGLLVPIGVGLQLALGWSGNGFGVLEAMGVSIVVGAAIVDVVPERLLWPTTAAVIVLGMLSERAMTGRHDWLAVEVVGGKFPVVTYVGFALVGMAAVHSGRYLDRRWVTGAALLALLAVVVMLSRGIVPDRYPGDVPFVVPGLAGTVLVYALSQRRWPAVLGPIDAALRRAGAHTLGIFLAHYALYAGLDWSGVKGSVDKAVAVPAAVAVTLVLCLVAPYVPQLPWSPRTGRRRSVVVAQVGVPGGEAAGGRSDSLDRVSRAGHSIAE